jgi:predicted DNA-binding WGR domain protein
MIRLIRKQAHENMARFYLIQVVPSLFGEWGVLREWGRIGRPGCVRKDWYLDETAARKASDMLLEKKLLRGYRYAPGSSDDA